MLFTEEELAELSTKWYRHIKNFATLGEMQARSKEFNEWLISLPKETRYQFFDYLSKNIDSKPWLVKE